MSNGFYKYKEILKEDSEIDRHKIVKELVNKYDALGTKRESADDSRDSKRIKLRPAKAKEATDNSEGGSPSTNRINS